MHGCFKRLPLNWQIHFTQIKINNIENILNIELSNHDLIVHIEIKMPCTKAIDLCLVNIMD